MTKRLGNAVAVAFGEESAGSPMFRIEEPTEQVCEQAWTLFACHRDKEYDLIDCISFATMESLRHPRHVRLRHHFAQYGFHLLPERLNRRPATSLPPNGVRASSTASEKDSTGLTRRLFEHLG